MAVSYNLRTCDTAERVRRCLQTEGKRNRTYIYYLIGARTLLGTKGIGTRNTFLHVLSGLQIEEFSVRIRRPREQCEVSSIQLTRLTRPVFWQKRNHVIRLCLFLFLFFVLGFFARSALLRSST